MRVPVPGLWGVAVAGSIHASAAQVRGGLRTGAT
ncbi:hypothetical protein VB1_CDS0041 [Arthrobacter phage Marchesin]|nr:hypothetical protein VB1_CDS0041 [Arthrobacter phage Marchesin]